MKLHLYFARKFFMTFLGVFLVFSIFVTLLDMVEQMRRFDSADFTLRSAAQLALLSMPETLYRMLPLVVILSTLTLFLSLARTSELVITRATGRSALRSLVAPLITAFLIGVFGVSIINPIVAGTKRQYEELAEQFATGKSQIVSVSREGLWLRQGDKNGQTVIRADRTNLDGTILFNATFIDFRPDGHPVRRVQAKRAELEPGGWHLTKVKSWQLEEINPEAQAIESPDLIVPSSLTQAQIRDSFGAPSAIPIWELPAFIANLDAAGFSANLHRVWFQMELALPLFLVSMTMIGAAFTMRHTRFGKTGIMVLTALMLGFGIFFIRNFAQILGENGQIPVALAAWAPPVAAICLALGLLLHLEDG